MKDNESKPVQIRRGKAAELLSKGWNQAQIAKELRISEATVSRDIEELRSQAVRNIEDHIATLAHTWETAKIAIDGLLRKAHDILENDKDLDGNQKIDIIKAIADLSLRRLDMHTGPAVIQKALEHQRRLREKIESLQRTAPKYEAVVSIEHEAGKPDKRKSRIIRKRLTAAIQEDPIV